MHFHLKLKERSSLKGTDTNCGNMKDETAKINDEEWKSKQKEKTIINETTHNLECSKLWMWKHKIMEKRKGKIYNMRWNTELDQFQLLQIERKTIALWSRLKTQKCEQTKKANQYKNVHWITWIWRKNHRQIQIDVI